MSPPPPPLELEARFEYFPVSSSWHKSKRICFKQKNPTKQLKNSLFFKVIQWYLHHKCIFFLQHQWNRLCMSLVWFSRKQTIWPNRNYFGLCLVYQRLYLNTIIKQYISKNPCMIGHKILYHWIVKNMYFLGTLYTKLYSKQMNQQKSMLSPKSSNKLSYSLL